MKNYKSIVAASVLLISLIFSMPDVLAGDIKTKHRACKKNEDCVLTDVGCVGCGVDGILEAINKKHAKKFAYLAHCTEEQVLIRMRTNCASKQRPVAACQNQQCVIQWVDEVYK